MSLTFHEDFLPTILDVLEMRMESEFLNETAPMNAGMNCIKIGLPGKLMLSKRKGLWEVLFS